MMQASPSILELLDENGLAASPQVGTFIKLAAAAQEQRWRAGVSDRKEITRTTALWALMSVDDVVEEAITAAGVDLTGMAGVLHLSGSPLPAEDMEKPLDAQLASALRAYLQAGVGKREIGVKDIAIAILESARHSPDGELPRRLGRLGIDYSVALGILEGSSEKREAAVYAEAPASDESQDKYYSQTVQSIRDQLGSSAAVTPAQIASAIQQRHPEYVSGRFADVKLRVSEGPTARVSEWMNRVRQLFDNRLVAESPHQVIDGQLLILGLAELDQTLAKDLAHDGLLASWRKTLAPLPFRPASDRTFWNSDEPADTDSLGRQYLAEALAKRLRSMKDDRASFMIHIDGPWGSGKSTLFKFLSLKLKDDFLLVHVNAWREQQVGVQWWTLLTALREAVVVDSKHRWWEKMVSRYHVVCMRWFTFLSAMLVLAVVITGLSLATGIDIKETGERADAITKIASLAALGFAGIAAVYRFLMPESRRSAEAFMGSSPNPTGALRELFARTLRRARKKPVVFLIDDLDRCDGPYIVEFLQIVQTLVREAARTRTSAAAGLPGPYAFIAADGQWIRSSYESYYASVRVTEEAGRPLGYQFLEKIFQLHVRLPSITEEVKQAYFEAILNPSSRTSSRSKEEELLMSEIKAKVEKAKTGQDIASAAQAANRIINHTDRMEVRGAAAIRFSELALQEDARHELTRFGKHLEPNPRSIKLFVNTYGTMQTLRTLEGTRFREALALWTVIEIRWPLLADYLRARPEDIDPAQASANSEAMAGLLRRPEIKAVTTDSEWGPLTPDDVRECTGTSRSV